MDRLEAARMSAARSAQEAQSRSAPGGGSAIGDVLAEVRSGIGLVTLTSSSAGAWA